MPFVPIPNACQAELRYTYQGQQVENTLGFLKSSFWNAEDLQDLGAALVAWYNSGIRGLQHSSVLLREIYLTSLQSETAPAVTVTTGLPLSGTLVGTPMPNNNSLCVSFRTLLRGRSFRGRNYIIGLVDEQVTGNNVNEPFALDYVDNYKALNTEVEAQVPGAVHAVLSRFTNNAPRITGLATPVSSYVVVDTVIDSQRRRLPGRGN